MRAAISGNTYGLYGRMAYGRGKAGARVTLADELATAVAFTTEASDLVHSYFGTDRMDVMAKGVGDVVTAADTAAETFLLDRIRETFPEDGVVGEEGARVDGRSGRTWHVDPLDGTLNFSRGLPIWCVSVALYDGDRPLLGVVSDPLTRETFSAGTGLGATCNGRAIHCSQRDAVAEAVVHITVDVKDLGGVEGLDDIVRLAPRALRTRNIGSAALGLAYVAAGRLDAMVHRFAHSWDYAAGVLLIQEAGGVVTDMKGNAYVPRAHDLCAAATPALHSAFLELLP